LDRVTKRVLLIILAVVLVCCAGATLWYHPHPHGETADQVYRGLAGMFIVDDATTGSLNLPKTYGVDDVPVIVQDKEFGGRDGLEHGNQFFGADLGVMGGQIVVNGTYAPYLDVGTELVRLRILNASNARSYNFGFDDDRLFALIGTDGGLLDKPARMDRVQLAMGERAEIVVLVKPGERLVLRSYDPDLGGGVERFSGGDDRFDVLQIRASENLKGGTEIPAQLSKIDRLDAGSAAITRPFKLSGHNINGDKIDMGSVDFTATVGTTEVWDVFNNDGEAHSFHVHDVQFQVLSVGDRPPPAHLSGWKDTISVHSDANYKIIMRFRDFSDPSRPYMYHCHVLFHEDQGMMGQFVVVKPGEKPGVIDHAAH
jgi:FtsP/CotA-like multicopper oxidase with cupredoxin domain